jgi:hypothetical protein
VLLCFDGVLMGAVLELNGQLLTSTTNPLLGNVSGVRKRKTRQSSQEGLFVASSPFFSNEKR